MQLARVVGTVVSTHKGRRLEGIKLLLLETIDPSTMKGRSDFLVAMDGVGAGMGEVVLCVGGSSARLTDVTEGRPTDASIIAVVDEIELDNRWVYRKAGRTGQSGTGEQC